MGWGRDRLFDPARYRIVLLDQRGMGRSTPIGPLDAAALPAQALAERLALHRADAIVLHANARDLARLVGQRDVRPVLMCGVGNQSLTDAYTSMKLLAQRARLMSFDLLVSANGRPQRAEANAQRLALTGDHFLGAVVRGHAAIDCRGRANAPLTADLQALARAQLGEAAETGFGPIAPSAAAWNAPAACPELSSLLY